VDYFMMRQDARVTGAAVPVGDAVEELRHMGRVGIGAIPTTLPLYVSEAGDVEYPDYIESPLMLVSEILKKIMGKYQKDVIFKTVVLIEKGKNRQELYYLTSAPKIDCASDETVYDARGDVKELVLDREKIGHARIFCADGYERQLLVRLDAAESILRRDPDGVWFEKVRLA